MTSHPLLAARQNHEVIAYRNGQAVTQAEFLAAVQALAARLPADRPLLNLCADRYYFAVALFAAIARGALSLLPNSTARENLVALHVDHPTLLCLVDQAQAPFDFLPHARVDAPTAAAPQAPTPVPQIPAQQLVAYVYTSGSTGKPVAHAKTFGSLWRNAQAEAARIWPHTHGPCTVIGTVPYQHMYGLESTVLLPLLGGGVLTANRPFFPADVAQALAEAPAPRFLVTTPFHLRNLLDANAPCPSVAALLSATAMLPLELAERAQTVLGAPMFEIYGSTETGMLATRRTTEDAAWEAMPGVMLHEQDGAFVASGGHLDAPQALSDVLELLGPGRFRLIGRNTDMVNIAGKRSSIAYLNQLTVGLPGVRDAAFCLPGAQTQTDDGRLAAFVVAPGLQPADLLRALRAHVDPVFLPRPIVMLDALPRNATGKLTAAALDELIRLHITKNA